MSRTSASKSVTLRTGPKTPRYLPKTPPEPLPVSLPIPDFEKYPFKIKKFCFCIRLKTAKIVMGLILYGLGTIAFIFGQLLVADVDYPLRRDMLPHAMFYCHVVILILPSICLLLDYCNGHKQTACVLIILFLLPLVICFLLALLICLVYLLIKSAHKFVLGLIVINATAIVLSVYFEVCVYSLYCSIRERRRRQATRKLEVVLLEENVPSQEDKRAKLLRDIASFVL